MFNWLTAFIALALLAFAFQIPLEARRATEQALKGDVARARLRADTTMAMRKELDRLLATDRLLQQRKLEAPSGVAVMEELTRLLPDQTWIASLQINQREVRLTGYAPTAASLVGLLDGSEQFGTPSFQSPVTQDARSGKERFSLSFALESDEPAQ